MNDKYEQLKRRLATISDLNAAAGTMHRDQEVFMAPGGGQGRGDQLATISTIVHEMGTSDEMGALLDALKDWGAQHPFESDEASLIRMVRRGYDRQVKVPTELVAKIAKATTDSTMAWQQARAQSDWSLFQDHLQKMVDLHVELADALGNETGNPYDALIDGFEPGLTSEYIDSVFPDLKKPLVELVKGIAESGVSIDESVLSRDFAESGQLEISREIIEALGYDFKRGRMDLSTHPFASGAFDDVRITVRVEDSIAACLMGAIHEAGHAMHFQNAAKSLYRTGIAHGTAATCESQSRFWENVVGRSRPFWTYWYPRMQAKFPQLADVDMETFYRALNKSQPSLIRVEADEVTYGLHIMLRYELENDLFNGRVKVADLPKEWNSRMEAYLGLTPPNDAQGVLQDIHWSWGLFGYFPTYLLGSILASQLWESMKADRPTIESEIQEGKFGYLLDWQREKIHVHGGKFTLAEITEMATGSPLKWQPYMGYLQKKYGEIYGL